MVSEVRGQSALVSASVFPRRPRAEALSEEHFDTVAWKLAVFCDWHIIPRFLRNHM